MTVSLFSLSKFKECLPIFLMETIKNIKEDQIMSISSISSQKDLWYILQQQRNKAQNSSNNAATAASSVDSTDVKSFLDKVKAGTVSDSDLSSMQTALTKLQEQYGSSSSSLAKPDDEISNFLDKVQSGTVTADDLSSMKTTLSQASNTRQTRNHKRFTWSKNLSKAWMIMFQGRHLISQLLE